MREERTWRLGNVHRAVCHLNIAGYRTAVATAKDRGPAGRPFVITRATDGRTLVLDLSPEVMKEGIRSGMVAAEQNIKGLMVLPPDPATCETMHRELERIAAVYAPAYESDKQGNLDLTGTAGLFGLPRPGKNHPAAGPAAMGSKGALWLIEPGKVSVWEWKIPRPGSRRPEGWRTPCAALTAA